MNFRINRQFLLNSLIAVSRAVSKTVQTPYLSGIKIDVKKTYILLVATNNELSIRAKLDAGENLIIEKEGITILNSNILLNLLRKFEEPWLNIVLFEEKTIKIYNSKSDYNINQYEIDAFPDVRFNYGNDKFVISSTEFKEIIKKCPFAASDKLNAGILNGVNFNINKNTLTITATDSYRLSKKLIINERNNLPEYDLIILAKSLEEVGKIIEEENRNVEIYFSKNNILIKYKNLDIEMKVIEGKYPKTDHLIPSKFANELKFNRIELLSAIERTNLFIENDELKTLKVQLNDKGMVEFSSLNTEIGGGTENQVPLSALNKVPFLIAFSSKYFIDAVKSFDAKEITLKFTGEIKPFIITSEDDKNYVHLILPIRVAW